MANDSNKIWVICAVLRNEHFTLTKKKVTVTVFKIMSKLNSRLVSSRPNGPPAFPCYNE